MASPRQFIFVRTTAPLADFVAYWSNVYKYREGDALYDQNIKGPHTVASLRELFRWKIGTRFFTAHLPDVERHFLTRMENARKICETADASEFLSDFPRGGVVYRIFWMHCWQPTRFPIYDQHVHRAMTYLLNGQCEELGTKTEGRKSRDYIERYLPFWAQQTGVNPRELERALWAFGKFIRAPRLPID